MDYSENPWFSELTTIFQRNVSPKYGMAYHYSSPAFDSADIGVLQTTTFTIDPSVREYAKFNCEAVTSADSGAGMRYRYGPSKQQTVPYSVNDANNPLGMRILSCTDTTVTMSYTPIQGDGYGFTLSVGGETAGLRDTGDGILLKRRAEERQFTGPYPVQTVRTPAEGKPAVTTESDAPYVWPGGEGDSVYGRVLVTKEVTGPRAAEAVGPYRIELNCVADGSSLPTFPRELVFDEATEANSQTLASIVRAGSVCSATEKEAGGADRSTVGSAVTITAGRSAGITVENYFGTVTPPTTVPPTTVPPTTVPPTTVPPTTVPPTGEPETTATGDPVVTTGTNGDDDLAVTGVGMASSALVVGGIVLLAGAALLLTMRRRKH